MNTPFQLPTPTRSRHANKGVSSESEVLRTLYEWQKAAPGREANRLVDTKAAGRIIKAAAADFEFFTRGLHGLIEVKETAHEFRLAYDRLTQWPRFLQRTRVGGLCILLVYHTGARVWRSATAQWLLGQRNAGDARSWDLRTLPTHTSAIDALKAAADGVF